MKKNKMIVVIFLSILTMMCVLMYLIQFSNKPVTLNIIEAEPQQHDVLQVSQDEQVQNSQNTEFKDSQNQDTVVVQSYCPEVEVEDQDEIIDDNNKLELSSIVLELSEADSFVTMNIDHDGTLKLEIQQAFDLLIGDSIESLLDLIAQSNNNVLSTDPCRTCAIDAILKKVSKHKKLSKHELHSLQSVVMNLYKFINTMQKLSNKSMLTAQQYVALDSLNKSQMLKNDDIVQARKATTLAALQSLVNIDMVQRRG